MTDQKMREALELADAALSCMCGVDIKHVAALAGMVAVHNTVERPIFGDWLIEDAKQGVAA